MTSIFSRLFGKETKAPARGASNEDTSAADALILEANALEDEGQFDQAIALYRRAIESAPNYWRAHMNLGNALLGCRRIPDALRSYSTTLALNPSGPHGHYSLANALLASGKIRDAETSYRRALEIKPDWGEAWVALGATLQTDDPVGAESAYRKAIELDQGNGVAARQLALLLDEQRHTAAARAVIEESLRHAPTNQASLITYGEQLARAGEAEAAADVYRRLVDDAPARYDLASTYLWTLNFAYDISMGALLAEHMRIGTRISAAAQPPMQHAAHPSKEGKLLKIGYLSPDLIAHAVANFLVPILRKHDRTRFEIHCFHLNPSTDPITDLIRSLSDHWHDVAESSDEMLARRIADNGIDILIDLAGHTAGNRLRAIAGKPAPVQFTWLGYLGTTGVGAVDYRLCDRFTDPPSIVQFAQSEKPAYLPNTQWCYEPLRDLPDINELPHDSNGYWTFGSFNQGRKLHVRTLALWAKLLGAIPASRLLFVGIGDEVLKARIIDVFASHGVSEDRLEIKDRVSTADYLASYQQVDVALDSYPYNGATTTLDSLTMGVPVATLSGERTITRGAGSLLQALGQHDWIATSEAQFVSMIEEHCRHPERVRQLRKELRPLVEASALMDGTTFTRDLEAIYHAAWKTWCNGS